MLTKTTILAVITACFGTLAHAALELPGIFSDHMVLQRTSPVPVWGKASPGTTVTVQIHGQTKSGKTDDKGHWQVALDPLGPGGPYEMKVSDGATTTVFKDILIGEVWLGSGQSNMEMPVAGKRKNMICDEATREFVKNCDYPGIRISSQTRDHLHTPNGAWVVMTPKLENTAPATMACAAIMLHRKLKVPVGIIVRAVSSSPSGSWISRRDLDRSPLVGKELAAYEKACPELLRLHRLALAEYEGNLKNKTKNTSAMAAYSRALDPWDCRLYQARRIGRKPPVPPLPGMNRQSYFKKDREARGVNFEKKIKPIIPYAIRGVVWDQGEAGTGIGGVTQITAMRILIPEWRAAWHSDFPFFYFRKNEYAPLFIKSMNSIPGVVMIDNQGLDQKLHPTDKLKYAERLVEKMMATVYAER